MMSSCCGRAVSRIERRGWDLSGEDVDGVRGLEETDGGCEADNAHPDDQDGGFGGCGGHGGWRCGDGDANEMR